APATASRRRPNPARRRSPARTTPGARNGERTGRDRAGTPWLDATPLVRDSTILSAGRALRWSPFAFVRAQRARSTARGARSYVRGVRPLPGAASATVRKGEVRRSARGRHVRGLGVQEPADGLEGGSDARTVPRHPGAVDAVDPDRPVPARRGDVEP